MAPSLASGRARRRRRRRSRAMSSEANTSQPTRLHRGDGPDASDQDVGQFDRWSLRYERSKWQWLLFDRVHRRALDLAARFVDPTAVLDVGCGSGRLLRGAHTRWPDARLFGVDPSTGMIEAGRKLTPRGLPVARAESIPFPHASGDLAFSTISLYPSGGGPPGVLEIARVLRPGGHFVL